MRPICLIGMSNAGKSRLASLLAKELGVLWLNVDGLIAAELSEMTGDRALAEWLGAPWQDGYQNRAKRYLAHEQRLTERALSCALRCPELPSIIDTAGSVIYLSQGLLEEISRHCTIVYLETPETALSEMIDRYFAEPKPLIWPSDLPPQTGGGREVREAYEALLRSRRIEYERLSHVRLPAPGVDAPEPTRWWKLLSAVKGQ